MIRRLIIAAFAALVVLSASPAVATPPNLLDVAVECPSGDLTIGFIDNNGSIVGFDEEGNVVQFRKLDALFHLTVQIGGEFVVDTSEGFVQEIGKGKGPKSQLEECTFYVEFANFTATVDEELAASFAADFGDDSLFAHIGEQAHIVSALFGDVWLKFPGR